MFESAYKVAHSTETALLKVQSDILNAIDKQESVLHLLLDFLAAFNTVDYVILLSRLNTRYGIKGNVLHWFASHLRTVPTIVFAHTFCASPDTRISYRQCLLIQGYFCAV